MDYNTLLNYITHRLDYQSYLTFNKVITNINLNTISKDTLLTVYVRLIIKKPFKWTESEREKAMNYINDLIISLI